MSELEPTRTYSNLTATDVLRRLLDERGVDWGNIRNVGSESDYLTEWQFENNQGRAIAIEWAVGSGLSVEIHRYHLTPEQAIAATLGSCNCSDNCTNDCTNSERTGTCHITDNGPWGYPYVCSACGASFDTDVNGGEFNFCPNCGAKVIEPTTNDVDAEVDE